MDNLLKQTGQINIPDNVQRQAMKTIHSFSPLVKQSPASMCDPINMEQKMALLDEMLNA